MLTTGGVGVANARRDAHWPPNWLLTLVTLTIWLGWGVNFGLRIAHRGIDVVGLDEAFFATAMGLTGYQTWRDRKNGKDK